MIVLDTNVLSELMREHADEGVLAWVGAQAAVSLFTTAVCEAEVFYGLRALPAGKRRRALEEAAEGLFGEFEGRVLAFDSAAARVYAQLAVARRQAGRPITSADAQIAAIARSRGARLATRNGGDFEGCGLELCDPWRA